MKLGIIGGSGLYEIEGLNDQKWQQVSSPFGTPSDSFMIGKLNARRYLCDWGIFLIS